MAHGSWRCCFRSCDFNFRVGALGLHGKSLGCIGLYGQHAFGNLHLSEGLIAGLDFFPRIADEMNSSALVQWQSSRVYASLLHTLRENCSFRSSKSAKPRGFGITTVLKITSPLHLCAMNTTANDWSHHGISTSGRTRTYHGP